MRDCMYCILTGVLEDAMPSRFGLMIVLGFALMLIGCASPSSTSPSTSTTLSIYVSGIRGLAAFDTLGQRRWQITLGVADSTPSPIVVGKWQHTLLVKTGEEALYGIDEHTGDNTWKYLPPKGLLINPLGMFGHVAVLQQIPSFDPYNHQADIIALNMADGHELWRHSSYSVRWILLGDTIYSVTYDPTNTAGCLGMGNIVEAIALQTGATIWQYHTPLNIFDLHRLNTNLFFITRYDQCASPAPPPGPLFTIGVLDAKTGSLRSSQHYVGDFDLAEASSTNLYFEFSLQQHATLLAFDASAQILWHREQSLLDSLPLITKDALVFNHREADTYSIYALDITSGKMLWQKALPGATDFNENETYWAPPLLLNQAVVDLALTKTHSVANPTDTVHWGAYNAETGQAQWSHTLLVTAAGPNIYLSSHDDIIYQAYNVNAMQPTPYPYNTAFSHSVLAATQSDGKELWSLNLDFGVITPMSIL
jgi:outer membrane protein assembly factor BamB